MIRVRQLRREMLPELQVRFLSGNDPSLSSKDWARLFFPSWRSPNDPAGYVALDGGRIVAVVGSLFSRREIVGQSADICNIHSWQVAESHRGQGLGRGLLALVLDEPDRIVTNFTPTEVSERVLLRLGFERRRSDLLLLPWLGRCRDIAGVKLIDAPNELSSRLEPAGRKILRDLAEEPARHLLLQGQGFYCHVVFGKVTRHVLPYCHIHHLSHPSVFARFDRLFRARLLELTRTPYLAVEARYFQERRPRPALAVPLPVTQLVRSSRLDPDLVDTLYSEVLALGLSTLPDLSSLVARQLRRRIAQIRSLGTWKASA